MEYIISEFPYTSKRGDYIEYMAILKCKKYIIVVQFDSYNIK
jgi:hypothetical protein